MIPWDAMQHGRYLQYWDVTPCIWEKMSHAAKLVTEIHVTFGSYKSTIVPIIFKKKERKICSHEVPTLMDRHSIYSSTCSD